MMNYIRNCVIKFSNADIKENMTDTKRYMVKLLRFNAVIWSPFYIVARTTSINVKVSLSCLNIMIIIFIIDEHVLLHGKMYHWLRLCWGFDEGLSVRWLQLRLECTNKCLIVRPQKNSSYQYSTFCIYSNCHISIFYCCFVRQKKTATRSNISVLNSST